MNDIKAERDYYRRQCDELGQRILRLQQELTEVRKDVRRSRTTNSLILKTYNLINSDVSIESIENHFFQAIMSSMSADRILIFRYDEVTDSFVSEYTLGLKKDTKLVIKLPGRAPEFLFVNSTTEPDAIAGALCGAIETPYILWTFNRHEGIALLIGNSTEDKIFRFPFEEKDRSTVESSLSVFIDIVRRKEAEKALLKSEGRYRRLVESSPESIFIFHESKLNFANNAGIKLLGAESPNEIIGKPLQEIIHPDDYESVKSSITEMLGNHHEIPLTERRFKKVDGSVIDVEMVAIPFAYPERAGAQIVALDISERKKMEMELLRIERIESIGVLAGGIAHDFNNILTGILGNIDLAKTFSIPESEALRFLHNAHCAATRAKELTQKLLTFSKGGLPLRTTTSISEIITDSVNFILSGSNIRFEYNQPDDLWAVDIDVVQFRQVIENLTINAHQSMPAGGLFTIRAENIAEITGHVLPLKDRMYVMVTVNDQGVGIPEGNLLKIFDPYFTTKDKGSGLGLATAYSIINKHDGLITVESEPGHGTTFIIYIPATREEPETVIKDEEPPKAGKGHVLVMDDEEMVRNVAVEMLGSLGFEAFAVKDGREAIEVYTAAKESKNSFDAVIMDLTIPGGMGGEEAIAELLEIDPDVKVIVSSGYSNNPVLANYSDYGFTATIAKPFSLKELSNTLLKATGA
ncbi:MAG: PAS domain S-box protein [Candidatus Aegiribacteria sp.]|nr:PAS domain S-box protein [Candidatus Aegiribacteria sp.]